MSIARSASLAARIAALFLSSCHRLTHAQVACLVVLVALVSVPATASTDDISARENPPAHRVYIDDPFLREAARRTVGSARARLASSGCERLLEELSNERGESLTSVLASLSVTPTRYLEWLIFQDGSAHRQCDDEGVLAFTTPGSRVIYLCGRAFYSAWRAKPDYARVVVIHELLHSLGLGENPPSSWEISSMVNRRCWP